ncbi:MAG: hypothetical protein ACE5ID_10250, partial [Acidobacteriota bacterium]
GVPDRSAGVTFAAAIRLQPAPYARLLSTLFHEMGHLGPLRSRAVEEAMADLTRRALLELFSAMEPGWGPSLLPALITGMGPGSAAVPLAKADRNPLSPSIYHEAARMALAFILLTDDEGQTSRASSAERYATAARKIRSLPTSEILRRVERRLPSDRFQPAAWRYLRQTVAPRLRQAVAESGHILPGLLAAALEEETPGVALRTYLAEALAGSETDRRNAHEVLLELAPAAERWFLDAWVKQSQEMAQASSASVALTRRGGLLARLGLRNDSRVDLQRAFRETVDPFQSAVAIVALARLDALGPREVMALMDFSPALAACGPQSSLLRGHVLARTGHGRAALREFSRSRALPGWTGAMAWARLLASMGRGASAAALLRRQAHRFRMDQGLKMLPGTLLLAGALLAEEGQVGDLKRAAHLLVDGPGADRALAEAARRLEQAGHPLQAGALWNRLLKITGTGDLAVEARQALRKMQEGRSPEP